MPMDYYLIIMLYTFHFSSDCIAAGRRCQEEADTNRCMSYNPDHYVS